MQTNMLGPQSNGMGLTTGAPPNKPDFSTYFGKPLREVKTNPYEGCAPLAFIECANFSHEFLETGMRARIMRSQRRTTAPTRSSRAS